MSRKIYGVTVGTGFKPEAFVEKTGHAEQIEKNKKAISKLQEDVNDIKENGTGESGEDGFSPIATVTKTSTGARISIQDAKGTTTADIYHGDKGDKGDTGATGPQGPKGDTGSQGPKGDKGDTGNIGIHIGNEPPTDDSVGMWIDTDDDTSVKQNLLVVNISNGIRVIDGGLSYSRGIVEIRVINGVLWVIDSGVYNFTSTFTAKNNRTILEFDLPKELSNKIYNANGVYGTTGTVGYFPALAYENETYTTFNCQSYLKRSAIGEDKDTYQLVYTGVSTVKGGGLCGFHLKMPLLLV